MGIFWSLGTSFQFQVSPLLALIGGRRRGDGRGHGHGRFRRETPGAQESQTGQHEGEIVFHSFRTYCDTEIRVSVARGRNQIPSPSVVPERAMSFELEGEVRRLEYLAQSRPGAHRRRVALWSALGYGLLGLFPLSLLGLGATVLVAAQRQGCLCLQNASAALDARVLRRARGARALALRVSRAPPRRRPGFPCAAPTPPRCSRPSRASPRKLGVRSPTRVLLTPDGGAGVAELPQVWGGTRSYLLLGLPLLESLTIDQLDAVLAHELAHLRGGDSRITRAATRIAAIWERLAGQIATQGAGRILTRLSQWYFPRPRCPHARRPARERAKRRSPRRLRSPRPPRSPKPSAPPRSVCAFSKTRFRKHSRNTPGRYRTRRRGSSGPTSRRSARR